MDTIPDCTMTLRVAKFDERLRRYGLVTVGLRTRLQTENTNVLECNSSIPIFFLVHLRGAMFYFQSTYPRFSGSAHFQPSRLV